MEKSTITTSSTAGLEPGMCITFAEWKPWYVRLWRWVTRYKPPQYIITKVESGTTLTISRPT